MKTASEVDDLVKGWISQGQSKTYIVVNTARAEMDWSYVWGAVGALCTPEKRTYYANRSICPENEKKAIISTCQALNGSGKYCGVCKWYPQNMRTLCNDCQGFAKQVFKRVGITLSGGGCTTMWDNNSNWTEKGKITNMPKDKVCLVFIWSEKNQNMSHVGIYCGNGKVIHCSKYVREGPCPDRSWGWSHYGIVKGLDDMPVPPSVDRPTLRKGSTGDWVVVCQNDLLKLGYDLSPYGADGKYGNKTVQAVKKFQTDYDIKPIDGICGQKTWAGLIEYAEDPAPTTKLYTVHIPHQTEQQFEQIKAQYPDAYKTEE